MNTYINQLQQAVPVQPTISTSNKSELKTESDFSGLLKSAIEKVNNTQLESDQKFEELAAGKVDDLHDVMISAQKASVTLETSVQIQKKVIDAYNEIMRMQV